MIGLRRALIIGLMTISACPLPRGASALEQAAGPKKKFHEVYARELDKQTRELFSFGFKCRFVLDYDNPMCVKCCMHDGKVPIKGKLDSNCECVDDLDGTVTKLQTGGLSQAEPKQATGGGPKGPSPFPMAPPNAAANLKPVAPPPPPPPPGALAKAPSHSPPPPPPPPMRSRVSAPLPPPPPPPPPSG